LFASRLTDAVLYGIASRRPGISLTQAVHLTRMMLYEDADSCMLRLIECFMESAPQLLLQLYILLSQPAPDGVVRLIAQYVSCGTSWLSLAWCLTAYQSALRNSRVEKANLRCLSTVFYFLWKAGVLLSRLLALALLADAFRAVWFAACLGVHWVVAVACLIHAGTTFCSARPNTPTEIIFDLVLGAVYCFDVINIREGRSRHFYATCYTVFGVENLTFAVAWFFRPWLPGVVEVGLARRPTDTFDRERVGVFPRWSLLLGVVGAFVLGIAMMLSYYRFAHPSHYARVCFESLFFFVLFIYYLVF
uniref:XK-related protein n=1 Tax=Schistocephalus solidus TaxID=70667 RepID=A0A183SR05_SCHSO